jgi:SAM-dependent methyltransferase
VRTAVTNRIRFVLDELLPRTIRDARWFMWPFFFVWFKGKHVRTAMDFKRIAPALTDEQFRDVYRRVTTWADSRPTDTNAEAMAYALSKIDPDASVLDAGCGRGTFVRKLANRRIVGCDLLDAVDLGRARYVNASVEQLPFRDRSFDVVTCFHTLEHTRRLDLAVAELRRVARKQLIVIVPRQKYFRYTMDLHLQFFPTPDALEEAMGLGGEIRQFADDLVYIAAA